MGSLEPKQGSIPLDPSAEVAELSHTEWLRAALDAYEARLVRYATRILGERERAQDVVQEVFLRLWKADRELVSPRLAPWLYAVCRNRALEIVRKDGRMQMQLGTPDGLAGGATAPAQAEQLERRETLSEVRVAMSHLPERQQEVIRLRFEEGLSYREIGEVTGDSVSNVGYMLHTAIRKIREQLGRAEQTEGRPEQGQGGAR